MEKPSGPEFLRIIQEHEAQCEKETWERVPYLGKMVPECLEKIGLVLFVMDAMASCFYGCRGGDHVIEYLIGRACASARASLRLLFFGYYDESLGITRSIGEIANLLLLFNQDDHAFEEWRALPDEDRRKKFSPVKVRLRLEEIGAAKGVNLMLLSVDEDRYRTLSGISVHIGPATKPQNYNRLGIPIGGGKFQEVGFMICLNELCRALGIVVVACSKVLGHDESRKREVQAAGIDLLASVGSVDVMADWRSVVATTDPSIYARKVLTEKRKLS
jgi:hypothetical protein